MDPLSATIPGSRHPITFPLAEQSSSSRSPPQTNGNSTLVLRRNSTTSTSSRRKPTRTYKSLAAHEALGLRIEGHTGRAQASSQHASDKTASESTGSSSNTADYYHLSPPLPTYHPLGLLALSVPALDPALYGHPNAVNVEEYAQIDADAIRRSSSRARRPAAKLRERDMADDDVSVVPDGSVNGQAGALGTTSPKKRRAGGVSGTRRRRRENGADGAYPNPPKRTRNTRGTSAVAASFASPLAGPSITTADGDIPDVGEIDGASVALEVQDSQSSTQAPAEGQEQKRLTRARRSRPAATRRHSSASETTTTSVSVSIAAGTRNTRSSGAKTLQELAQQTEEPEDVDMKMEENGEEPSDHAKEAEETPKAPVGDVQAQERRSVVSEAKESGDPPVPVPTPAAEPKSDEKSTEPAAPIEVPKSSQDVVMASLSGNAQESTKKDDDAAVVEVAREPQPQPPPESSPLPVPVPVSAPTPASVVVEKTNATAKPKEPSIPEKPKAGQKISPSSWTRFVPPIAGPTSLGVNQKKARDEEKEEGELSEESEDSIPPRRR